MTRWIEPLDWNNLDPDERRIMRSAIERDLLMFLVVSYMPARDVNYPNRWYRYVPPLMEAAKRLIRLGRVAVVPTKTPGPPVELSADEALEVVGDINNWWRYDPGHALGGRVDKEDSGVNPVPGGLPPIRNLNDFPYQLTDTNHGEYHIVNWTPPERFPELDA